MHEDGRAASVTKGSDRRLKKRAGIAVQDLGIRKGSLAPREEKKDREARDVVRGTDAVNGVAKYVC